MVVGSYSMCFLILLPAFEKQDEQRNEKRSNRNGVSQPAKKDESVDYSRCAICRDSSEVELMNIQTTSVPKFLDATNARQDKTYSVLKDEVRNEAWTTDKSPKWHTKCRNWYTLHLQKELHLN